MINAGTRRRTLASTCLLWCAWMVPSSVAAPLLAPVAAGDIVVTADKERRPVTDVVKDFTPAGHDEQVAYWNQWLCLKVDGLILPEAKYLHDRIAENIRTSGLHVLDKENCPVNVKITFPQDSDVYVNGFVKERPGLYRDLDRKGFPPPNIVTQLLKPRPVRWLPVRRDVSVAPISTDLDPHIIGFGDSSHITKNTGALKIGELVVVDYRRLHHVTWKQLADYISMVVLTEPDMDTDYRHDGTILSLFASPDDGSLAPLEMTDSDRLIVKGFAKIDARAMPFAQRDTIARTVEGFERSSAVR